MTKVTRKEFKDKDKTVENISRRGSQKSAVPKKESFVSPFGVQLQHMVIFEGKKTTKSLHCYHKKGRFEI